jgi:SAM-dependent methyltransferase
VINIESSLHYPRFPRFLAEVVRVLRPEGHFLYADFRPFPLFAAWEAALANAQMRTLSQREINAEVVRGVERFLPQWLGAFDRHKRTFLARVLRNKFIMSMPKCCERLQSGELSYRMYCFAKA